MSRAPELPAIVKRTWTETHALVGVELDAAAVSAVHRTPGQYLHVAAPGAHPAYFAIATAPGRGLELLVKRGTTAADALAGAAPGAAVHVSTPLGPGYPVDTHAGRDLVLVASGSGIAPLRAVVQHVLQHRRRWGEVTLWYGQRHASEFAYAGELAAWERGGVHVIQVLSGNDHAWSGARGRVQDALRGAGRGVRGAVACVAGQREMVHAVRETLSDLGVAGGDVLVNF